MFLPNFVFLDITSAPETLES